MMYCPMHFLITTHLILMNTIMWITITEATVFIFLKRQHVIQKHPPSCSSCREVIQDMEDLGEKFGQRTKISIPETWEPACWLSRILSMISEVSRVGSRAEHIFIFLQFLKPFIRAAFCGASRLPLHPHPHSGPSACTRRSPHSC